MRKINDFKNNILKIKRVSKNFKNLNCGAENVKNDIDFYYFFIIFRFFQNFMVVATMLQSISVPGTDCLAPMRSCSLKQCSIPFLKGLLSLNSKASSAVVTALLKTVHAD